jgi:hypothetical protein
MEVIGRQDPSPTMIEEGKKDEGSKHKREW